MWVFFKTLDRLEVLLHKLTTWRNVLQPVLIDFWKLMEVLNSQLYWMQLMLFLATMLAVWGRAFYRIRQFASASIPCMFVNKMDEGDGCPQRPLSSQVNLDFASRWFLGSCRNVDSDPTDLGQGLRICVSKKLPGDADTAGPGPTPCTESLGPFLYVRN